MPSASSVDRPHSHEIIIDLLSEARHLVVRERAMENNNLLQIQQVIEAAQRELRLLRIRSSVETIGVTEAQVRTREEGNEVGESGQEYDGRNYSHNARDVSTDGESDRVALMTVTVEQTPIDSAGQPSDSSEQSRAEEAQSDTPLNELDLYLGHSTSWTLPNFERLLQRLPGHEDTWRPAVSAPETQQTQTQRGISVDEGAAHGHFAEDSSSESNEGVRPTSEEEVVVNSIRTEVEDIDPGSPSAGLDFFDTTTGRPLVYTDLSHLQRRQSFVNFTDRRLGRATSSSLPDPGNVLDQTPRDENTSTITSTSGTAGGSETTESEEDSSGSSSYEDLGAVTPLPTPPRSPIPTLHRENASISSTGATAGSPVGQEEGQEEPEKKEQSPFSKERRAQLMAAMTADIVRYSQARELDFYQEHGYCIFPKAESPDLDDQTNVNTHSTGVSGNGEGRSSITEPFRRLLHSRRQSTRVTLPTQSIERRPVSDLPDPAEEFLVYLLS
jgi:hypothetical protein